MRGAKGPAQCKRIVLNAKDLVGGELDQQKRNVYDLLEAI